MNGHIRAFALASVLTFSVALPALAQQQASKSNTTAAELTPEQMERFMLTARVVSSRSAGDGVTNSKRATITDGTLVHDVHVQSVDESKAVFETPKGIELNFRDTYRYNIAAYRLARLLGMNNVPMSVDRALLGQPAAVTWWIDDVTMDEGDRAKNKDYQGPNPSRFAAQVHVRLVFDELIQNKDRNLGNIVWTKDWTMWLIDHTRAFRNNKNLLMPGRLERCDRALLTALRGLTRESVKQAVGATLTNNEIDTLVARAEKLVKLFDQRIAKLGEAMVMFTLPTS